MRVDLLFYCGEEKRKEYTQDAYNKIYVQKWRPPTAIQILYCALIPLSLILNNYAG